MSRSELLAGFHVAYFHSGNTAAKPGYQFSCFQVTLKLLWSGEKKKLVLQQIARDEYLGPFKG